MSSFSGIKNTLLAEQVEDQLYERSEEHTSELQSPS